MSVRTQVATDSRTADKAYVADGTLGALSDSKNLRRAALGLMIHAAGTVRVTLEEQTDGAYVDMPALAVGVVHPLAIKRLWSTGTSVAAANIQLFYAQA